MALESIQEFQLLANNYKAEHGRASGGVINVLTRSGANTSHGSAFFAVSDDAHECAESLREPADSEPPFHMATFGGSAGGRLVRDRWHYFMAYEGVSQDFAGGGHADHAGRHGLVLAGDERVSVRQQYSALDIRPGRSHSPGQA